MTDAAIIATEQTAKRAAKKKPAERLMARLLDSSFPKIRRKSIATLQVNLGYYCNQSCVHCHVNASPYRTERMSQETAMLLQQVMERVQPEYLDLTGGAPELNENFRQLVLSAKRQGIAVIDRCNLTVLFEPGQESLAEFLAENQVSVVASLPCYSEENVEKQRGKGVFQQSIAALQKLNRLGYGKNSKLQLNLVFNPQADQLPPPQDELERAYKQQLQDNFGITFNKLYTLANMPINRFGSILLAHNRLEPYLQLLRNSHNGGNLAAVMCRSSVSVDWQGYLYDCDFNQMLGLSMRNNGRRGHLRDLLDRTAWDTGPIRVAEHCYGCTAGQGSSCGGALN